MIRATLGLATLLTVTLPVASMAQAVQEAQQPPTALDREENNPAKAAARVSEALKKEAAEGAKDLSVGTHAEAVVVTGEVDSEAAAARAKATAESAAGGTRVATHLEVREGPAPAAEVEAARLARSVEAALKNDKRTAQLGVTVTVDATRQIGLHGLVPTRESRALAESVAGKVAGPRRIRNHLQVPGG